MQRTFSVLLQSEEHCNGQRGELQKPQLPLLQWWPSYIFIKAAKV
jgi:hypothetical protein